MIRAALLLLLIAAPAGAQVYGLTEAEKAQVLDSASRRPDADNPALLPAFTPDRRASDRRFQGEIGAMIGTGGARGIYGIVGVPIGETGSATFAFSNTRLPGFYGYGPQGGAGFLDRRAIDRQSFGFGFSTPGF